MGTMSLIERTLRQNICAHADIGLLKLREPLESPEVTKIYVKTELLKIYLYVEDRNIWKSRAVIYDLEKDGYICVYDYEYLMEYITKKLNRPISGINTTSEQIYHQKTNIIKEGIVYFIFMYGYVKIGITNNFEQRKKQLETSMPFKIDNFITVLCNRYTIAERELHDKYSNKRMNGEWFAITTEEVSDAINYLLSIYSGKILNQYV